MDRQVTIAQALSMISVVILPLFGWGISVENRFSLPEKNREASLENKSNIKEIKESLKESAQSNNANFILVIRELNEIKLELKDKKNRD